MESLIKVGILGLSQRVGRFNELGLRSWEESGCAEVERHLLGSEQGHLYEIHRPLVIRSDRKQLERLLREWCDAPHIGSRCDLILTVAGTGLGPDDVLPDATAAALRHPLPGIAQFVRHATFPSGLPEAMLSRAVAGIRHQTLIINLPGPDQSLIAIAMEALVPLLPAFVRAAQAGSTK